MSTKSGFLLKYSLMTMPTSGMWAIAARELGFPKQTDGKRIVKGWRAARSS
ncbi:MAG: hypothetical protein WCH77_10250 [Planctomycetota bacterium]